MQVHSKALLIVLAQATINTEAFSPLTSITERPRQLQIRQKDTKSSSRRPSLATSTFATTTTTRRKMSQWDDEEEEVATTKQPSSFEQAGEDMKKQDDDDKLNSMGEFDANPSYSTDSVDQIREAIKKRADALGIEQSPDQLEFRKKAEERAKQQMDQRLASGGTNQMEQLLDLSQISDAPGKTSRDDDLPAFMYDPENDLTEQQMKEADPTGELPFIEQQLATLKKSSFPTFFEATVQVFTLIAAIVFSVSLFFGYDKAVRLGYQKVGVLPTEEMVEKEKIRRAEKRAQKADEKDLMKGLKNFEEDVPAEL